MKVGKKAARNPDWLRDAEFGSTSARRFGRKNISAINWGYAARADAVPLLVEALAEKITQTGAEVHVKT